MIPTGIFGKISGRIWAIIPWFGVHESKCRNTCTDDISWKICYLVYLVICDHRSYGYYGYSDKCWDYCHHINCLEWSGDFSRHGSRYCYWCEFMISHIYYSYRPFIKHKNAEHKKTSSVESFYFQYRSCTAYYTILYSYKADSLLHSMK